MESEEYFFVQEIHENRLRKLCTKERGLSGLARAVQEHYRTVGERFAQAGGCVARNHAVRVADCRSIINQCLVDFQPLSP